VPGRNKRAVSAEGKEEMPRLWADHQARLSRSRTDPAGHEHVTDIFIHSTSSSSATHSAIGVTKQPGEKSSCASGRGVTARDRVAVGRRAEVLGVRDLPRGSIVWRVPDVRARPNLNGIIRRDQVLAHGEVADVDPAGAEGLSSSGQMHVRQK